MIYLYYPLLAFLIIPLGFVIIYFLRPRGARNILRVASKILVIFIILLSIASPYTIVERPGRKGSTDITIVADKTESMRLFKTNASEEVYGYLGSRIPVTIDHISGTKSSIGDSIVKNVKSGGSILLISDGNNNYGRSLPDAINFARSLNATVYSLSLEPVKKDMRVSIDSDSAAISGTPSNVYINVDAIGAIEGDLEVRVDDNVVHKEHVARSKRILAAYSFNTTGSHTIKASLVTGAEDEFPQNNVFYRSIHVVPKPRILLVSKGASPLSRLLTRSYSVDISSGLTNVTSYRAVVLDDMSASELSNSDASLLSDYVVNGGGLIVAGGIHAYQDYKNSPVFEQLLPVKAGGTSPPGRNAGVVLVIDISGSTGELSGIDPKLGIEKGLSLQILNSIETGDFLGIIAFNNAPHTIVPLGRYTERSDIEDTVSRLRYGGTTHLAPALDAARNMVKNFEGGKNVLVISDGIAADGDSALAVARSMAAEGITVHAIGVGGDTDEDFMTKLAQAGGGGYLRRDQIRGVELLFGEAKSEKTNGFPLLVINSGHFITKDIALNATVYGYNDVFTKKNAQALLMTSGGNPVISAWRFGLGRVVSITVDNGNAWAPELYMSENSRIITSSTNYAIGNPSQGFEIQARDGEIGLPLEVNVYSDHEPDTSYDGERIQFARIGERLYSAAVEPNSTGFHDLSGYTVAVNEPSEYREPGNNELLDQLIKAQGGRVYNQSEIALLIPDIRNKNTGIMKEAVDLRPIFLFAALLLYSIEVILRRIRELWRL